MAKDKSEITTEEEKPKKTGINPDDFADQTDYLEAKRKAEDK